MALNEVLTGKPVLEPVDSAVDDELRFIADWESGKVSFLGAITRVRQVHRAFPWIFNDR